MSIIGNPIMAGASGPAASIFVTGLSETDTVTAVHKKTIQVPNPAAHGLPDGYTELEYIESSGTQYIDTGFSPKKDSGFYLDFEMNSPFSSTTEKMILGCYNTSNNAFCLSTYTKRFSTGDLSIGAGRYEGHIVLGQRMQAELKSLKYITSTGGSENITLSDELSGALTVYLFASHDTSASGNIYGLASSKLYSAKLYDADIVIRNFIPAKRISDSAIGLYDLVNNVFYTNAGTGTFTAGSEIPAYIETTVDDKTLTGKWTQKSNPVSHGLPDGYTRLEYIQSSGTQYIKSGIAANSDELTVECDGIAPGTGYALFGSEYSDNVGNFRAFEVTTSTATNSVRFNYYESTKDISSNPDGVLKLDRNNCYINGSLVHTFSPVSWSVKEIWLFARNNNGSISNAGHATIRYCKIWVADELVRHFVPCKRNSDGELGMYDLVNDVFYTNAGTGTFTAGPEVPQTIDGFLIKPIRDLGTWTVTATNGTKTATQDVMVDAITEYEIEMSYKLWLYKNGVEYEDVTGGWVGTESGYVYSPSKPLQSGVKNSDNMFCGNATSYDKVLGTNNKVDLTGYSKIYFTVKMTSSSLSNPWLAVLIDGKDIMETNRFGEISDASSANVKTTRICDISGITGGEHYVAFACTASSGGGHCYEIWAE